MVFLLGRNLRPSIRLVAIALWLSLLFSGPGFAQDPLSSSTNPTRVTSRVKIQSAFGRCRFVENGKPVLVYQHQPLSKQGEFARANYVHPLFGFDGEILTEDFPDDHLHHRGVFWAWHQVLVGGKAAGDSWMTTDFLWEVKQTETTELPKGAAVLTTHVDWLSPEFKNSEGRLEPLVHEETSITVFASQDRLRFVDFEIKLLAAKKDVFFGGSDDGKGYGGFSARIKMPSDLKFTSANGVVTPKRNAVSCGNWVNFSGTFDSNRINATPSGVAIFVHPSSAGFPQSWILRASGSMQNPVYPGRKPVSLSLTKPTFLRYRMLIQKEVLGVEKLNEHYENYAQRSFPPRSPSESQPQRTP